MTKKSKTKRNKEDSVSPEVPAVSLPPPCAVPTDKSGWDPPAVVSEPNEELKKKLFRPRRSDVTLNLTGDSAVLQRSPEKSYTNPVNNVVNHKNGETTYIIDSTKSSGDQKNGAATTGGLFQFQAFQKALEHEIQGRENPARFYTKDDVRFGGKLNDDIRRSEICIDMGYGGTEDEEDEEEEEEILGLDAEHENKLSPNGDQKYQFYSNLPSIYTETYNSRAEGNGSSTGSSPGSGLSPFQSSSAGLTACSSIIDVMTTCEVETCDQLASFKCNKCKKAYYCSEEHRKSDRKHHKENCIAYKMRDIGDSRSAMVAVRDIPEGKKIFAEKPFLIFSVASNDTDFMHVMDLNCVLNESLILTCEAKRPACLGCMKCVEFIGAQRHRCSTCGLPLCSPHCENETLHKLGECSVLSRCTELTEDDRGTGCLHSLYMDVEILRALYLQQDDLVGWEKLLELRRHVRVEVYKKSSHFALFKENMQRLVPLSAKVSGYNIDLISDVHAIITALSFKPALQSPYKMLVATQLYFAHGCVPNTIQYVEHQGTGRTEKLRCVVKAAVPIMKDDIILIDFVPTPYLAYNLRRKVLENLCLNCKCGRCESPSKEGDHSGDIMCPNCRKGYVHAERAVLWKDSVWSCDRCQEEVSYAQITQTHKDWSNRLANIPKTREGLPQLVQFVRKGEAILNRNHELVVLAWCFIESIIRPSLEASRYPEYPDGNKRLKDFIIEDYKLLREYCEVCEHHFKAFRPGIWLDTGIVQFQKFCALFALTSRDFQDGRIPQKDYINKVVGYIKILNNSLSTLQAYEGNSATPAVQRITQDATCALTQTRLFVEKLLRPQVPSNSSPNRLPV